MILGRVGTEAGATDTPNATGTVAFALALDPTTGQLYIAQYLSLLNPTPGSTAAAYDEPVSLSTGALQVQVTNTDGDGDTATASLNIGNLVSFQDDGPTAPELTAGAVVAHDETPGVQTAADPNAAQDVLGTAPGYGTFTTVAAIFAIRLQSSESWTSAQPRSAARRASTWSFRHSANEAAAR